MLFLVQISSKKMNIRWTIAVYFGTYRTFGKEITRLLGRVIRFLEIDIGLPFTVSRPNFTVFRISNYQGGGIYFY